MILWVIRVIERVVGVVSSVEDYERRCLHLDEANGRLRKENSDLKASLKSATESLENETRIRKEYESCISFETSCVGCAKLLDMLHASEAKREECSSRINDASGVLKGEPEMMFVCYPCGGFWCQKCDGGGWVRGDR